MAAFYNNTITNAGRILQTHIQSGAVFTPTRIVMGSGEIPAGKTVKTMTDVAALEQEIEVTVKQRNEGSEYVEYGGTFSNEDVTTPFYFRELALFAKAVYEDGTETDEYLYSYGNNGADAELIPAYSTSTVVERVLNLIVYVGNEAAVDLTVTTGLYVTKTEYDTKMEEVDAHIDDADIHVTAEKKTEWDGHVVDNDKHVTAAQKTSWDGHVADTDIHVTAANKTSWDGHIADTTKHVTAEDKETWNGLDDFVHIEVPTAGWVTNDDTATSEQFPLKNTVTITSCLYAHPIWSIAGATESTFPTVGETDAFNVVKIMDAQSTQLVFYTDETEAPVTFYCYVQGVSV